MVKRILQLSIISSLLVLSLGCNAESAIDNKYQDGITLTITNKPFEPNKHTIQKCTNSPCIIDGKIFYGGNGNIPKSEVASLVFSQEGKTVNLEVSSMYDSGITNANIKKYITIEPYFGKRSYRIVGYFGGDMKNDIEPYIVHWLIVKNASVRNHIGDYESLTGLVYKVNEDFNIPQ